MLELLIISPSTLALFALYFSIGLMFVGFLHMMGQLDMIKTTIEEHCKSELDISDPQAIKTIQNTVIFILGILWLPHVLTLLMMKQ